MVQLPSQHGDTDRTAVWGDTRVALSAEWQSISTNHAKLSPSGSGKEEAEEEEA